MKRLSVVLIAAVALMRCSGGTGDDDAGTGGGSTATGGGTAAAGGGTAATGGGSASTGGGTSEAGGGTAATGGGTTAAGGGSTTVDSGTPDAGHDAGTPVPYDPCPTDGGLCKIMPLGDSITAGVGSSTGGGYRVHLYDLGLADHKKLTFVGSQMTGPNTTSDGGAFPRENEGHSGYTIQNGGGRSGIYELTDNALATYKPDIITLMIGTNDVDIQLDLGDAGTRLGQLLDKIHTDAPNTLVVLAKIVPTKDDTENIRVTTYNNRIPALAAARADAGFHITTVDMYGAFMADVNFKTDYMNDNLHPNNAGHAEMADTWYVPLKPLLH